MAPPLIFKEAKEMRAWVREQRRQGKTVGFVPTMVSQSPEQRAQQLNGFCRAAARHAMPLLPQGFLHEGHISLVKAAR